MSEPNRQRIGHDMHDQRHADALALSTPLQRLEASRERMRTYLLPRSRKPQAAEPADASFTEKIGDKLGEWRHHPLVGAVIDAVEGWWAHHPMRSATDIGTTVARELAGPLVRTHPVASVAGALVVGALLVRVKPWRWVLRPALFAGLTTHVVSRLLSDAPMEFVLNTLMKLKPHDRPQASGMPGTSEGAAVAPDTPLDPLPDLPDIAPPAVTTHHRIEPETAAPASAAVPRGRTGEPTPESVAPP